jgi:pimeloyl-ACP methyl ester carboxylesterase
MERRNCLKYAAGAVTAACALSIPQSAAAHDEMDPDDMVKMAKMMPNAASVICPNGSHMDFWDDQAFYFQHLLAFLNSV